MQISNFRQNLEIRLFFWEKFIIPIIQNGKLFVC